MLRQLEAAKPTADAEASLEEIEQSLPKLNRDLGVALVRADNAVEELASTGELEDIQRELRRVSAPLAGWKDALEAEAKRVSELLDEISLGEQIWSETRERAETAGDVVARRVAASIEALRAAVTGSAGR